MKIWIALVSEDGEHGTSVADVLEEEPTEKALRDCLLSYCGEDDESLVIVRGLSARLERRGSSHGINMVLSPHTLVMPETRVSKYTHEILRSALGSTYITEDAEADLRAAARRLAESILEPA